jgi:hypothetical protein
MKTGPISASHPDIKSAEAARHLRDPGSMGDHGSIAIRMIAPAVQSMTPGAALYTVVLRAN